MSELEELPSWAGRSTGEPQAAANRAAEKAVLEGQAEQAALTQQMQGGQQAQNLDPQSPRRRRPWTVALYALLGLLALFGMGAAGYFLANYQGSSETETAGEVTTDEEAADDQLGSQELIDDEQADDAAMADDQAEETATDADAGSDAVTLDVADEEDAATETEEDAEAEAETDAETDQTQAVEGEPERQAIFRGGKVYLIGSVPSEEIGKVIEDKAAAVVGPDNVVNEYVIDPESVIVPGSSAPLYVEDVVLFEFNSIEIARPFLPILDLGTLLLRQNPQASISVVTRTDAVGSEAVNLDVSTKRAQAVINYWIGKGVNPDQIVADPRGEEGASEDDDEQTAALNRRAEFIITGLLD